MSDFDIRIEGAEEIARKLSGGVDRAAKRASMAIAAEIHRRIAPYPPASEANSPRDEVSYWYERGFGTRYKTGKGRRTSQTLGRKWSVKSEGNGALVINTAGYANWVHDSVDQAWFHNVRDWKTDEDVVDEVEGDGTVERLMGREIAKLLGDISE